MPQTLAHRSVVSAATIGRLNFLKTMAKWLLSAANASFAGYAYMRPLNGQENRCLRSSAVDSVFAWKRRSPALC